MLVDLARPRFPSRPYSRAAHQERGAPGNPDERESATHVTAAASTARLRPCLSRENRPRPSNMRGGCHRALRTAGLRALVGMTSATASRAPPRHGGRQSHVRERADGAQNDRDDASVCAPGPRLSTGCHHLFGHLYGHHAIRASRKCSIILVVGQFAVYIGWIAGQLRRCAIC